MQWHEDFFLQAHDELSVRHILQRLRDFLHTPVRFLYFNRWWWWFSWKISSRILFCVFSFFLIYNQFSKEIGWVSWIKRIHFQTLEAFSLFSLDNNNNNEWEEQEEPRASGARLWRRKPIILMENGEHPTMENCFLVYVQLFSTENYFSCLRLVHLITEEWNSFHNISSRKWWILAIYTWCYRFSLTFFFQIKNQNFSIIFFFNNFKSGKMLFVEKNRRDTKRSSIIVKFQRERMRRVFHSLNNGNKNKVPSVVMTKDKKDL